MEGGSVTAGVTRRLRPRYRFDRSAAVTSFALRRGVSSPFSGEGRSSMTVASVIAADLIVVLHQQLIASLRLHVNLVFRLF